MQTQLLPANEAGIAFAARLLQEGQTVAIPTETVYGLAADATSNEAYCSDAGTGRVGSDGSCGGL